MARRFTSQMGYNLASRIDGMISVIVQEYKPSNEGNTRGYSALIRLLATTLILILAISRIRGKADLLQKLEQIMDLLRTAEDDKDE